MGVTARATIQGALKLIGVLDPAETMQSADSDDGLFMLNNMVDAWNLERLSIFSLTELPVTFSGASATIGPLMTVNTPRPIRIESAFWRRSSIDYPLRVVTDQEYSDISMKSSSGDPEVIYYDAGSPTGSVYVWPVPASTDYRITVLNQLTAFADLDTLYDLPQGYAKALMYALAIELAPLYQKEASTTVARVYVNVMRTLKRANVVVPILCAPLPGNTGNDIGRINILNNQ